jgi:RNA polymerase sigma-70 factor (ECF subfamily)
MNVAAPNEAVVEVTFDASKPDLETVFHAQYDRIARVIACILRDPARGEELAVDVFLKWSRNAAAQGDNSGGWLYRTAVRMGLNELRRQTRRKRYESMFWRFTGRPPEPDKLFAAQQEQERVRQVLGAIPPRKAELLLLRSHGLSYEELASALQLNPGSVGTLLNRAAETFRKEFIQRYGE